MNQKTKGNGIYGWNQLDESNQNKLIDLLYDFGWKGFLSWKYDGKLLNHSTQYKDHHNHLHMQTFNINKVIDEVR